MKLNISKLIVIALCFLGVSCINNSNSKHTLIITDDCGCVRKCTSFEELQKIASIVISAQPDIFCLDAASPDNVNFKSKIGYNISAPYDSLFKHGYDPYGIMVDSIKAHGITFLANIRMNDHHGRMYQWSSWARKHKEWSLGKDNGDKRWRTIGALRQMDYSIPQVREHRLAILKEIMELYPVNGIQLDFIRSTPFLSQPKVEKAKFMTEYVQSVRNLLDETAKTNNSGRLLLGIVVPWDYDFCIKEGLNLETWIERGLVDYITPNEFYYANWNLSLSEWTKLIKNSACKLYPATMGNVSPYQAFEYGEPSLLGNNGVLNGEKIRAIADNYMAQQPDGFAFYNYYPCYFGEYYPKLRDWTDPRRNQNGKKQYFIGRKTKYIGTEWGNFDEGMAYAFVRDSLMDNGDKAEFKFQFSTPLENIKAQFRMAFKYKTANDKVTVKLNGMVLNEAIWEYENVLYRNTKLAVAILSCELLAEMLKQGENVVSVTLGNQPSHVIETGEFEVCTTVKSEYLKDEISVN